MKKILIAIIVLMFAMTLMSCTQQEQPTTIEEQEQPTEEQDYFEIHYALIIADDDHGEEWFSPFVVEVQSIKTDDTDFVITTIDNKIITRPNLAALLFADRATAEAWLELVNRLNADILDEEEV